MTTDEIKTILDNHGSWLRGETSGCRADLRGADLRVADLRVADLRVADLRGAKLRGADLRGADLSSANLGSAYLSGADLRGANLSRANLGGADFSDSEIPIVEHLDKKILAAIDMLPGSLDMSYWHMCETTHCRAGWAITIAGKNGAALEEKIGPCAAGAFIYHASTGKVPDFFASNEDALADIRKCAGVADAP